MGTRITSLTRVKTFTREESELLFGGINDTLDQLVSEGRGSFVDKHRPIR